MLSGYEIGYIRRSPLMSHGVVWTVLVLQDSYMMLTGQKSLVASTHDLLEANTIPEGYARLHLPKQPHPEGRQSL